MQLLVRTGKHLGEGEGSAPRQELESEKSGGYTQGAARNDRLEGGDGDR